MEVLYRNQSIENLICKCTKQVSREGSSTQQFENGSRKGTQFVVGRGLEQPESNIRGVKIILKKSRGYFPGHTGQILVRSGRRN